MDPLIKSQLLYQLSYAPTVRVQAAADIAPANTVVDTSKNAPRHRGIGGQAERSTKSARRLVCSALRMTERRNTVSKSPLS